MATNQVFKLETKDHCESTVSQKEAVEHNVSNASEQETMEINKSVTSQPGDMEEVAKNTSKDEKGSGKSSSRDSRKSARDDKDLASSRGGRYSDGYRRSRDSGRRSSRERGEHRGRDKNDREVCRNFLHSRCDRGELCKFYHPRSPSRSRHGNEDESEHRRSSPRRSSPSNSGGQIVCRDFIRNMCSRGTECRFFHPPTDSSGKKRRGSWLTLCHDFRNGMCLRSDCRFFHITRDDEESYRASGEIPVHIVDQAVRKVMVLDGALRGTRPICKEFLRGLCYMSNCRFRHLNQREYENEVFLALQEEFENLLGPPDRRPTTPQVSNLHTTPASTAAPAKYNVSQCDLREGLLQVSEFESEPKRPRFISNDSMGVSRKWDDLLPRKEGTSPELYRLMQQVYVLRNENEEMRRTAQREISELKEEVRRVMEENASMRRQTTKAHSPAADSLTLEHRIEALQKETSQLRQALAKANEEEKARLCVKQGNIQGGSTPLRKDLPHHSGNSTYTNKDMFSRDMMEGDVGYVDMLQSDQHNQPGRYSDAWGDSISKNNPAQYTDSVQNYYHPVGSRSQSWHSSTASSSLMGEYQGPNPSSNTAAAEGLVTNYGKNPGNGQGMMRYDGTDFSKSSYIADNQYSNNQEHQSGPGWQQVGGEEGSGQGIGRGWRRGKY